NPASMVSPPANSSDVSSQSTLPSFRAMKPSRLAAMWIVTRESVFAIVSFCVCVQHRSQHQVAAVDVEGCAGDVAGGFGGGEANQIGDFEGSGEGRHEIPRGTTFEHLVRGMFASQLGIDHAGADSVHGDAELAECLRGRTRKSEESGLRCRVVRTTERAHHSAG